MNRQYWLDVFTGKTWEEFLAYGATVSGFPERKKGICSKIEVGDYFLCYVTGISRFIGILEVLSKSYTDYNTKIWNDGLYPVRFKVKIAYKLEPEIAIPVLQLRDKLSIFSNLKRQDKWSGFFRNSPTRFNPEDANVILQSIQEAIETPIKRAYDNKIYGKSSKTYESPVDGVTVSNTIAEEIEKPTPDLEEEKITHTEIQWTLLKLGSDLGLDVWVARNDRNKEYNGSLFKDIPGLRDTLPGQFDYRIIENIDVLWLRGNGIIAAFEVEHTTQIFSGLLRMSDLISIYSNQNIDLYVVAPDERRGNVMKEFTRPTFSALARNCKYIAYSRLKKRIKDIGDGMEYTKHEFIKKIAESCITNESKY